MVLVSRQDAIDALCKMLHDCFWADDEELDAVITTLNDLPSAQPNELSCDGCKFCGQFEYQFPCKVCIRREKDYYARPD